MTFQVGTPCWVGLRKEAAFLVCNSCRPFLHQKRFYRRTCRDGEFRSLLNGNAKTKIHNVKFPSVRCSNSSSSDTTAEKSSGKGKTPFGYTRKDVLLIGLGITALGVGLKYGLEFAGVDPLTAGNAVQLIVVLGLTVGWISTYMFRVSNKEMTYAQQLRDYESKVMEKRLEGLTEAELAVLLEQIEEERRLSQ